MYLVPGTVLQSWNIGITKADNGSCFQRANHKKKKKRFQWNLTRGTIEVSRRHQGSKEEKHLT